MTYRNTLCVDNRCNSPAGCAHRGKQGQYCDFSVEQSLCNVLKLHWHPGLELDSLLAMIQDKIAALPSPDDYAAQVKLATARTQLPIHPATLTASEEDQI